jgi:hypothetical protein
MNVIRRRKGERRASTAAAASVRWIVYVNECGQPTPQGSYNCPHEAAAAARELRQDTRLFTWVQTRRAS